jgi:hypothetical protein
LISSNARVKVWMSLRLGTSMLPLLAAEAGAAVLVAVAGIAGVGAVGGAAVAHAAATSNVMPSRP